MKDIYHQYLNQLTSEKKLKILVHGLLLGRFIVWAILFGTIVNYTIYNLITFDRESYDQLYKLVPSIDHGLLAVSLLVISLLYKHNIINPFHSKNFETHNYHWFLMNIIMMTACIIYSIFNIYIAYNLSIALWEKFNHFNPIGIMIISVIAGMIVSNMPIKT